MPGDRKFDLGDYVEVKDRIRILYELYPQARLVTDEVTMLTAPDNKQRVMVKALAYRNPDDTHPGVGYSWMELPGTTSYTKGSELENTETSAWGRAIASLGILIDASIATAQEIDNKQRETSESTGIVAARTGLVGTTAHPVPEVTADGGLIGTAITDGKYDFGLRQTPDGWRLPFRVRNGSKSFIVIAEDTLAEVLAPMQSEVIGSRVTVWGHWTDETVPAKGTRPKVTYKVLHLDRIQTPEGILPAVTVPSEPSGEPLEAETAPLFDDVELPAPPDDVVLAGEGLGLVEVARLRAALDGPA